MPRSSRWAILSSDNVDRLYLILTVVAYGLSLGSYLRYLITARKLAGRGGHHLLAVGLIAQLLRAPRTLSGLHTFHITTSTARSLSSLAPRPDYLGLEVYHRNAPSARSSFQSSLYFSIFTLGACGRIVEACDGNRLRLHVTLSILAYAAFGSPSS